MSEWTSYTPEPPTTERKSIRELVQEEAANVRRAARRFADEREQSRRQSEAGSDELHEHVGEREKIPA